MKQILGLISFSLIIFSCKKADERTCWKGAGENSDTTIYVSDFIKLYLHENLDYELIQDSLNKVEIIGGKNLISFIQVNQNSDGTLEIKNTNKCNFLRYKSSPVKVRIHFKNLTYMTYKGTEKLMSKDTLNLAEFQFFMVDGGGSIDLDLNVSNKLIGHVSHGAGDFRLRGFANEANFKIMTQGSCDTRNLSVLNEISIVSNANSPCFVNANNSMLKAEITGQGNVYYQGVPTNILFVKNGVGELIPI